MQPSFSVPIFAIIYGTRETKLDWRVNKQRQGSKTTDRREEGEGSYPITAVYQCVQINMQNIERKTTIRETRSCLCVLVHLKEEGRDRVYLREEQNKGLGNWDS